MMSFGVLAISWGIMIRFRGSHSQALCMANSPNNQPYIDGLPDITVLSADFGFKRFYIRRVSRLFPEAVKEDK
jgi:hypothetical protein